MISRTKTGEATTERDRPSRRAPPPPPAPDDAGGTAAVTRKGKERTVAILMAARELLAEEGYGGLTLRAVARRVGMRLANLQYYYATREQLLEGLLHFIVYSYDDAYARLWEGKDQTPTARLGALLEYLMQDVGNATSNRLFFEIWALTQRNEYAARLVDWAYSYHRSILERLIAAVSPDMPPAVRSHRAALIAAQIDGLMIQLAAAMPRHPEFAGVEEECMRQFLRLASWEDPREEDGI